MKRRKRCEKKEKWKMRKTCLKKAKNVLWSPVGCAQHLKATQNTQHLTFKVLSINWKLKRSESQKVPASRQHQAKSASANTTDIYRGVCGQHPLCKHTHTHTHTHTLTHTHSVRKIFIWCLPLRIYDVMSQCKAKQENYESQTHTLSLSHRPDTFLGL